MAAEKRIILLHGWGSNVAKLSPLNQELKKLGWKTVVLKLPGFDNPPPEKVWGIEEYGQYVLKKAQEILGQKKFFLFGHSFGGKIAAFLAAQNTPQLAGAVLCAPSGFSRPHPLKRTIFLILAKTGKKLFAAFSFAPFLRKILYKVAREHDYEKTTGIMRKIFQKVVEKDLRPVIKKTNIPLLVLWGKKDKMTPIKDARFIKKTLSTVKLVVWNKAGHLLPYQYPKTIAQKINQWHQNLT